MVAGGTTITVRHQLRDSGIGIVTASGVAKAVKHALRATLEKAGLAEANVELVRNPPWNPQMISPPLWA